MSGNVIDGKAKRAVPDVSDLGDWNLGYQIGQGRHHIALGFANPALYNMANTSAFHDVTSNPQGQGYTEAVVTGPGFAASPYLSTMGLCATTRRT